MSSRLKHWLIGLGAGILFLAFINMLGPRVDLHFGFVLDEQKISDEIFVRVNSIGEYYENEGVVFINGTDSPYVLSISAFTGTNKHLAYSLEVEKFTLTSLNNSVDMISHLISKSSDFEKSYFYSKERGHSEVFAARIRTNPIDIEWQEYDYEIEFQLCDKSSNCSDHTIKGKLLPVRTRRFGFLLFDRILSV